MASSTSGSARAPRAAWTSPRVDFCYVCRPGGPFSPPSCRTCGSQRDYFSQGLCSRCHPRSPEHIDSCKGCLSWGVYPRHNWTCWSCRWWHSRYPKGTCAFCGRDSHVSKQRACRLCLENARLQQEPGRAPDLAAANQHSQQLFFANMAFKRRVTPSPRRVKNVSRATLFAHLRRDAGNIDNSLSMSRST